MNEEIWKDIPGYAGYYQVSNLGRVRSLDRTVNVKGAKPRFLKGEIMKLSLMRGYPACFLHINRIKTRYDVHKLVAMAFLNHTPCGYKLVVDHINNIKTDNRLENLQLVSARHNVTKDKKHGSSKYTGVSWNSIKKKWKSEVYINGKNTFLGYFTDEAEAALAYQKALEKHEALKNC